MQTFVPSTDFGTCVRVLDYRRLGKQRVECGQILSALASLALHEEGPGAPKGWTRHPATLMWRGYESALGVYMTFCIAEWERRGYTNNMVSPFSRKTFLRSEGWLGAQLVPDGRDAELPPWWGDERVHSSHRNALLFKDPEHYRQFRWDAVPVQDYHWPVTSERQWTPDAVTPSLHFRKDSPI